MSNSSFSLINSLFSFHHFLLIAFILSLLSKGQAVSFCSSEEKDILAESEKFLDKDIMVMGIDKNAYRETLDFTKDTDNNWKRLIRENEIEQKAYLAKKKKKKK